MTKQLMNDRTMTDAYINPSEDELSLLKYKLEALLRTSIVEVSFSKANGTERIMKCTLKPTIIPIEEQVDFDGPYMEAKKRKKRVPDGVIAVWDIEKNGWRSFRVDSVHDYLAIRKEV